MIFVLITNVKWFTYFIVGYTATDILQKPVTFDMYFEMSAPVLWYVHLIYLVWAQYVMIGLEIKHCTNNILLINLHWVLCWINIYINKYE